MKTMIIFIIFSLFFISPLHAVKEDKFVEVAADSYIVMHKYKGDPKAMDLWMDEMRKMHPEILEEDWKDIEKKILTDAACREDICGRILNSIKAKGYNARVINIGGKPTVEILD